jgi:glycosyltransferase involved in cell wall biosynthesis
MSLIANMVVKNEVDRYLEEVLSDLLLYVDKIVITDDASTDNTVEVCKRYTPHVYSNAESLFCVDEAALRQSSINNLGKHASPGDWILAIDADEIIWSTRAPIKELIRTTKYDVISLEFINMWNPTHYRVDKMWKPTLCTKLFRYVKNGKIKDRKLACGSEPTYVEDAVRKGRWLRDSGLKIQHLGYMFDEDKKIKYDRYMEIDGGKFHSGNHLKSIMDKKVELLPWDFERIL